MAVPLQRLRVDLRDFDPAGVACLAGGVPCPAGGGPQRQPWVAVGKHLCGAAADFALLCVAQAAAAGSRDKNTEDGLLQVGRDCRAAGAGGQRERACCGAHGAPGYMSGNGCSASGAANVAFPACVLFYTALERAVHH